MKHTEASEVPIGIIAAVGIRTIVKVWAELYYPKRPGDTGESVAATRVTSLASWSAIDKVDI